MRFGQILQNPNRNHFQNSIAVTLGCAPPVQVGRILRHKLEVDFGSLDKFYRSGFPDTNSLSQTQTVTWAEKVSGNYFV